MKKKLTVTIINHEDVKGKTQYYVKIENEELKDEHLINISQKTWDKIFRVMNGKEFKNTD